jgi:hypothetical protein
VAHLSLTFLEFSRSALVGCVHRACGATQDWSSNIPDQVRYLYSYLQHSEMNARTIVVEHPYTDRHYLSEYQGYYATSFRPPPSRTTRLHFFSSKLDEGAAYQIAEAATDVESFRTIRREYQNKYLGFVVVRPLESAPIGRTVLHVYGSRPARIFGSPPPPHRAHLLGLTLKARGVQFHQQDRAVGACATAAVSAALSAVIRRDGGRAPTTLAITEQANRSAPEGRIFPAAGGLSRQQMIGAVIASGYSPDVIKPARGESSLFLLAIMTYVRSGIPVVMQLCTEGAEEGHAVTVVGFRVSDATEPAEDLVESTDGPFFLRSKGISKLYVHDDRLGPYARMRWQKDDGEPTVTFVPYGESFPALERPSIVSCAIAPLYPKIRMSALDVLLLAGRLLPVARQIVGPEEREAVYIEPAFRLAGDYVEEILRLTISRARVACLTGTLSLSRYVAVIRFMCGEEWLLDVVCDATDIYHDVHPLGHVLAVVPRSEDALNPLAQYFQVRCPDALVG